MAGRFEGLNDVERRLFENILPATQKKGRGRPVVSSSCSTINRLQFIIWKKLLDRASIFSPESFRLSPSVLNRVKVGRINR